MDIFLTLGFFLTGLGAIVATGIMMWRFIGGFTRLVDQNARTMAFTAALAEKMAQQHDEIVRAIECLTEKIGRMADG